MSKKRPTLQDCINAIIYVLACIVTGAIGVFGVLEMASAIWTGFGDFNHIQQEHDLFINGLLRGLECFLLAPMPLLLVFAIRDLIPAYKNSGLDSLGNDEEKTKKIERAHFKLQKLKTIIIGLMVTAMATKLLEKSFGEKLDLQNILPDSVLMLLLIGYAHILDRHENNLNANSRKGGDKVPSNPQC